MSDVFDLFRATPLATSLVRLDNGRVVDVNDAYLQVFGESRSEVIGSVRIETGSKPGDETRVELQTKLGPKTLRAWTRTIEIDDIAHVLSTFVEVTERERAADATRADNEPMRELTDNIDQVLWLTDANHTTMLLVTAAYERMFGRSTAALDADARDWLNALHPEDRPRMMAFLAAPPGAEHNEQYRVVRPDGTLRNIQVKVFPVRDAAGVVIRLAGIAEDITDRLQLEEQVRQTQKMESLGLLAGGISHDFNNILAVIAANASLLNDFVPEGHPDRELVEEIDTAVRRGASLTRQLLAFSRKQVVESVVVDLNAAVNDTRKMLRRMVGEDVVITTSLEPELCRIRIDPGYLVQVLMNLAVNARDAMPRGGTFTITTRNIDSKREVMFTVSDTGCGMPPDVKARVFEPFFTTKGLGKGTGLGLSVVHGIIEQAGGRIEIDSEVDVGTTFRVFLPLEDAPVEVIADVAVAGSQGSENVIIVDDDPYVRRSISRTLRSRGYNVFEAGDGRTALQLLRVHGKDVRLLVTDVVMPGMDGQTLVEIARRRRPSLPVLFISGYTDDAVLQHGVKRADVSILEKPFRGHILAGRVRQLLDAARGVEGSAPTGSESLSLPS
jgi:two-component system cell cycle sensor histidine kinase/response regulator CckA